MINYNMKIDSFFLNIECQVKCMDLALKVYDESCAKTLLMVMMKYNLYTMENCIKDFKSMEKLK